MTEAEVKEYKEFMKNPDNAFRCDICPERKEIEYGCRLPCGQWQCWVRLYSEAWRKRGKKDG